MSKSIPNSAIFVHDDEETIRRKIMKAFCPPKQIEENPVMDLMEKIVFNVFEEVKIEKKGDKLILSLSELKDLYLKGEIHPLDLKNAAAKYINEIVKPIREHFKRDKKARKLYEIVKGFEVTR